MIISRETDGLYIVKHIVLFKTHIVSLHRAFSEDFSFIKKLYLLPSTEACMVDIKKHIAMNGLVSCYQPYHQLDLTCANSNTLSPWVAFGVRLRDMSDNVSNLVASMRSSIVTAIPQISCA